MNFIRNIIIFIVLIIFLACSDEKRMIEEGNFIITKIEHYREKFGEYPDSLSLIGIEIIDESNPPYYYEKEGDESFTISFSNGVGESKIYYSDSRQWEDFPRKIVKENIIIRK